MPDIQFKRGTDTARTDGTLTPAPSSGEPIYCTDTKTLFVGDGSTAHAIPATVPASLLTLFATSTQDINALSADNLVEFNAKYPGAAWGVDMTHSNSVDNHKVTINTAGIYEVCASLALDATASTPTRYNGKLRVVLNGSSSIGPEGKGGYIRESSGQDETSLHITTFAYQFAAADYIWLKVDRESSTTEAVDTTARASVFYIKRIK